MNLSIDDPTQEDDDMTQPQQPPQPLDIRTRRCMALMSAVSAAAIWSAQRGERMTQAEYAETVTRFGDRFVAWIERDDEPAGELSTAAVVDRLPVR